MRLVGANFDQAKMQSRWGVDLYLNGSRRRGRIRRHESRRWSLACIGTEILQALPQVLNQQIISLMLVLTTRLVDQDFKALDFVF
jgi:hypothetical protein